MSLEEFKLSDEDNEYLLEKGMSKSQIEKSEYRTYPYNGRSTAARKIARHIPEGTENPGPGLYKEKEDGSKSIVWRFGGASGILIPIRKSDGTIYGAKIRKTEVSTSDTQNKYVSLSTNPESKNGEESKYNSGTKGEIGLHWPINWESHNSVDTVIITEGELKADFCCFSLGENWPATISISGVGQWQLAVDEILSQKQIKNVILALDIDRNVPAKEVESSSDAKKSGIPNYKKDKGGRPKKKGKYIMRNPVADAICNMHKSLTKAGIAVTMLDWKEEHGKGIDDVLTEHGEDAISTLNEDKTSEWCRIKDIEGLGGTKETIEAMESMFLNRATDKIYSTRLRTTMSRLSFVGDIGVSAIPLTIANQGNAAAYEWAAESIPRVDGIAPNPAEAENAIYKFNDQVLLNTHIPNRYLLEEDCWNENPDESIEIFHKHCERIFTNEEERRIFIDFLAHNVQFPGKKIHWAVLIQGPMGSGKSFFGVLMNLILGRSNVSNPSNEIIHEQYTDWLVGKTMVFIEELKDQSGNGKRFELMNRLKPIITGEDFMHRQMRSSAYPVPNTANIVALTNHPDAIRIENQERRYFVSRHHELAASEPEYYNKLFGWVNDGGWKEVAKFLMQRDIEEFYETVARGHAPKTTARQELVEESRTEFEVQVTDMIQNIAPPFTSDVVKVDHLRDALPKNVVGNMSSVWISRTISRIVREIEELPAGAKLSMPGRYNKNAGGGKTKLLIVRNHEKWSAADPADLMCEHYRASGDPDSQIGNPLENAL